jgi:glutamate-1-semialdehyde 2,1-aminomutase
VTRRAAPETTAAAGWRLADRARDAIPGGVNSGNRWGDGLDDVVVAAASGARFTDVDGREYLDYHGAGGPALLGHCRAEVDRAAAAASASLGLTGVARTEPEIRLAERLSSLVPSAEQVLLTNSGSEATYHALRLARAATGRPLIVKFQGCYHGWHDAVAVNLITPAERLGRLDPLSAGALPGTVGSTAVLPFNDLAAAEDLFHDHGGEIAAVIVEPIAHNVGALLPEPGFLEGLRRLCSGAGAVLVFDEVITGFRHALGGYQSICGVLPDLTTLGKALGNGYPIGALVGRRDLMGSFSTSRTGGVFFAGTYNAHPGGVAAALATLDVLESEPVHERVFRLGELARAGLRDTVARLGIPAVVTGYGSVFVTYFMDPGRFPGGRPRTFSDLLANDDELFRGYRAEQFRLGVFEFPRSLKRSHVSAAHTDADVDALVRTTAAAIETVAAARKG